MITAGTEFYLLGMGNRRKMYYKSGQLIDAISGEVIRSWDVQNAEFFPDRYCVLLHCVHGQVELIEDECGVAIYEGGIKEYITTGELSLPHFEGHKDAVTLRILHQEILFNILDGKPLPNLFVYQKPWYRDAAMVCMCLIKTGNMHLVKDWILSLCKPYDNNNAGVSEPDNIGQALYMISLVSDLCHPLVPVLLDEAKKCSKDDYIIGLSDFSEHPVYQTKWLKYGLAHLGLEDNWRIPDISDSYSQIFWMDYKDKHAPCEKFDQRCVDLYPYLGWAQAHFYGTGLGDDTPLNRNAPLTWECEASEAEYGGIRSLSKIYADRKYSAPHTWHAAEAFLYLYEDGGMVV